MLTFDSEPEPVGWDLALDTNRELNYVLCDSYYQTYHLLGSSGEETHEFRTRPLKFLFVALTELDAFLSHPSHRGTQGMDVMEV